VAGPTIVLIHGAAVTSAIWARVVALLPDFDTVAPERPRSGSLEVETQWLAERIPEDAFVVGMSGGATLGLALAASPVRFAGALLHEPAVGSLAPGLLAPFAQAFESGGPSAFGAALYGPLWSSHMTGTGSAVAGCDSFGGGAVTSLARELAMFRAFEPGEPAPGQGPVTISVGELSPRVRHESVAALASRFGYSRLTVPGARHFVTHEAPHEFAALVRECLNAA